MNWYPYMGAAMRAIVVFGLIMGLVPVLVWMELKGAAHIQDRRGSGRAATAGLRLGGHVRGIADTLKLLTKTDIVGERAAAPLFVAAPILAFMLPVILAAVIPLAQPTQAFGYALALQIADLNAGLLYVPALTSLSAYPLFVAGWSSCNKYSFIGGLRAVAQTIGFAVPMGLALTAIVLVSGSMNLGDIVAHQGHLPWTWNIVRQPIACLIVMTALAAQTNRLSFDPADSERELVAGYHTEYSSMKFALFFVGAYAHVVVGSLLIATLFLGGWQIPFASAQTMRDAVRAAGIGADAANLVVFFTQAMATLIKAMACAALCIWVRWSLPRFRSDQLLMLGFKVMLPLGVVNLVVTAAVLLFISA